jgi:hypothetical protein
MAGLMSKVARFARSPQGRKMTERAKQIARDPKTRRKIDEFRGRTARKRAG